MSDAARLERAYRAARDALLAARNAAGHWAGHLSSSVVSTATAVSALALVERARTNEAANSSAKLAALVRRGVDWIVSQQNGDGGFGDTDRSYSNIATTFLARAALHLAGRASELSALLARAEAYLESGGGVAGVRQRYGEDRTFAVPILTHSALAGLVPWSEVEALPFELACVPQEFYRCLELPVVSYAIPALVAIGQAKYWHDPPWNPLLRGIRQLAIDRSLEVLRIMQPASGGYLEAAPLTSFVTMSLAATGRADHPVAQDGVRFLVDTVREDGSWPIDTNLATWNTTLALNALAGAGEPISQLACLPWLLSCQHRAQHPFTGAAPGGWGWTDLSGAVPDADDTPGALLALAAWKRSAPAGRPPAESTGPSAQDSLDAIDPAVKLGLTWLLDLQNDDGGWPTFCRGWTRQVFDRSGADLTAHALRALAAWRAEAPPAAGLRIDRATRSGLDYLRREQRADGSWVPLWFGNQDFPNEENPWYGTAKVLLAYRELGRVQDPPARRGTDWLVRTQNPDGGWGGGQAVVLGRSGALRSTTPPLATGGPRGGASSVEETALVVEALAGATSPPAAAAARRGVDWLVRAVEENRHTECSPIGFYFARLWYYEGLYPLTLTVAALGQARQRQ